MEENSIGTDASMSVHIQNIVDRKYVEVDGSRQLTPTKLGKCLINTFMSIEPELVQPQVRAKIENNVGLVAKGKMTFQEVIKESVDLYRSKFLSVVKKYKDIIAFFKRHFKLDSVLYAKRSKELTDEIYKACKDTVLKKKDPLQISSFIGKCDCGGMLYIDYNELERHVLPCTKCTNKKKLLRDIVTYDVINERKCPSCDVYLVHVELENPFLSGEYDYTGCVLCDPEMN